MPSYLHEHLRLVQAVGFRALDIERWDFES